MFINKKMLLDRLCENPSTFDFQQTVRLLCYFSPEKKIQFHGEASLRFPTGHITRFVCDEDTYHIFVSSLSLLGATGALPLCFTEMALECHSKKDVALLNFVDIFNHGLLRTFQQAWSKHHWCTSYEGHHRRITAMTNTEKCLLALMGVYQPKQGEYLPLSNKRLYSYSALFAGRTRSVRGLSKLLCHYLGCVVRIFEYQEQFYSLPWEERTALLGGGGGIFMKKAPATRLARLGHGALLGKRYWRMKGKIIIQIGPMSAEALYALLSGGENFSSLRALITFYLSGTVPFSIYLQEETYCNKPCTLGGRRLLGWNTWLPARRADIINTVRIY